MKMLFRGLLVVGAALGGAPCTWGQVSTAFMRLKNGTDYNPISLAATDADAASYPNGLSNGSPAWANSQFRDGDHIVVTTLGSSSTGTGDSSGASGLYENALGQSSSESVTWKLTDYVSTSVSPTYNTQLQPSIGINSLQQSQYGMTFSASNPQVDDSIQGGIEGDTAAATGLFLEPGFDAAAFEAFGNWQTAPVQYAIVSLDKTLTPVGTIKKVAGNLLLSGQATFTATNGDCQGGAFTHFDMIVTIGGQRVLDMNCQSENGAIYSYMSNGMQYMGFGDFTMTANPSFSINFDGTAAVSDQSSPVDVVDIAYFTWFHLGEKADVISPAWGAGFQSRGDPSHGGGNGQCNGGGQVNMKLSLDIVSP